jgi:hypothetical protein
VVPGRAVIDVGLVAPAKDDAKPLTPDEPAAGTALSIAPEVGVETPDPARSDVVKLVDPSVAVIDELPGASEDVLLGVDMLPPSVDMLLLGVDMGELDDDESGGGAEVCGKSIEIPVLPRTDPVWMLEIGLHGVDGVLVRPGG